MQEILAQAQAAANEKQLTMYVFRAFGPNGHEVGWFNASGRRNSPKDELVCTVEPEAEQSPS
ncbi:hypothetical protein HA052_19450 [Chromobacterium haemolyticum]|uniref:Uncharacterized protein n=1 Tax=Chromobacterium fluminis TaxID=3044269 RepID=A0ABX0L6W3_9NEIS|nr:hypothetical protein [Chromobacterium haemolyticum]NHR07369.1 hypothetical protein [Chromobacterium haemolyticum]